MTTTQFVVASNFADAFAEHFGLPKHSTMLEGAIKLYRAFTGKEVDSYHTMAHAKLDAILDAERKMAHHLSMATRLLGSE